MKNLLLVLLFLFLSGNAFAQQRVTNNLYSGIPLADLSSKIISFNQNNEEIVSVILEKSNSEPAKQTYSIVTVIRYEEKILAYHIFESSNPAGMIETMNHEIGAPGWIPVGNVLYIDGRYYQTAIKK